MAKTCQNPNPIQHWLTLLLSHTITSQTIIERRYWYLLPRNLIHPALLPLLYGVASRGVLVVVSTMSGS